MTKKKKAIKRRRKTPNPASPAFPTGRMVPVRSVMVNKRGVLQKVVIEDRHMGKLKKGKK